jgi:hypothetical protein
MTQCNACKQSVADSLIANRSRHNTGGDVICLPCHIEATTSGWHQLPRDAGQVAEVTYAADWENGTLYRRTHDRSDGTVTVEHATITGGEFEPWNGVLPQHDDWVVGETAKTKEQKARDYAAAYELPLISVGMPEDCVTVDGQPSPIQGTTGCRLSIVNWLRSNGWGRVEEIVEDDGQVGRVTWTRHDDGIWEATSIEWSDIL